MRFSRNFHILAILIFLSIFSILFYDISAYALDEAELAIASKQLLDACYNGNDMLAAQLLKEGANIEARDENNATPLILAASSHQVDTVKLLLDKGANVNAKENTGKTALFYACNSYYPTVAWYAIHTISALLDKGADINAQDNDGRTVLHYASHTVYTELIRMLLDKGANIEASDNKGITPLHIAACLNDNNVPTNANNIEPTDTALLLLVKGANIKAKDILGDTPLHYATASNCYATAILLLKKGANINVKDNKGITPLHVASGLGLKDFVEYFINNGASIEARDALGNTPLYYASHKRQKDIVELLLANGADRHPINNKGDTPDGIIAEEDIQIANEKKELEAQAAAASAEAAAAEKVALFNALPPEKQAEEYYKQGCLSYTNKDYSSAAEDFEKTIELDPKFYKAHLDLAKCYEKQGQIDDAISELTKHLKFFPKDKAANNYNKALLAKKRAKEKKNEKAEIQSALDNEFHNGLIGYTFENGVLHLKINLGYDYSMYIYGKYSGVRHVEQVFRNIPSAKKVIYEAYMDSENQYGEIRGANLQYTLNADRSIYERMESSGLLNRAADSTPGYEDMDAREKILRNFNYVKRGNY